MMPRTASPLLTTLRARTLPVVLSMPHRLTRPLRGAPPVQEGVALDADHHWLCWLSERLDGTEPPAVEAIGALRADQRALAPVMGGPLPDGLSVEPLTLPLDGRTLQAERLRPRGVPHHGAAGLVFFHGGGWVLGDLTTHRAAAARLADEARCTVIAVDYRLAPEHPFPQGHDDAWEAWCHLVDRAPELGLDPTRLGVAGDSAGGNLAGHVAAQAAHRDAAAPAVSVLIYPGTDMSREHPSIDTLAEGLFLTRDRIRWFKSTTVPDRSQWTDPRISLLLDPDLAGRGPTVIATAGFDPLRDEGRAFADALQAAGTPVTRLHEPALIHGYLNFAGRFPAAAEAVARLGHATAAVLHAPG